MPKAHRIFLGIAYCNTCYVREFVVVACRTCEQPTRVHKSVGHGLCRSCECKSRLCIRCNGPVVHAALRTPDGAVCKKCRRYFEPFPKKYPSPKDYETCSTCRRHRKVAKYDERKRPVCVQCDADPQHAQRSLEEQHAYWFARLVRQTHSLKEGLESTEWQALFVRFIQSLEERMEPGRAVTKMPPYIKAFSQLEALFPCPSEISSEVFLEKLTTAELRQMELVTTFLHNVGFKIPTRAQANCASDRRRIIQSLSEVSDSRYCDALQAFVKGQMAALDKECPGRVRSIRLNVRAAVEFLKFAGGKALDRALIVRFLKQSPGHRACLYAFVGFLRADHPGLKIPKKALREDPPSEGGTTPRSAATTFLLESANYIDFRAAVAGWLMATFGIPLTTTAQLPRSSISLSSRGEMTISLNGRAIQLPEQEKLAVKTYLELRDALVRDRSEWLFPGRPKHHPITTEGLRVRLVKHNVIPAAAGRAARARIIEAAEQTPLDSF
jgi:hypothetical protein